MLPAVIPTATLHSGPGLFEGATSGLGEQPVEYGPRMLETLGSISSTMKIKSINLSEPRHTEPCRCVFRQKLALRDVGRNRLGY